MLAIRDVVKQYDGVPVLRGVSIEVVQGEILCLLGPSGCGKTTLLRIVAGLEGVDGGQIELEGQDITRTPVHQRDFGLMFQDFALFPHMTVAENIAFGLKMRRMDRAQVRQRVAEVLELVGLGTFGDREVAGLSGGEQQRVALARSLAPRPRLLMLDEPLGSLDAALRERLAIDLRDIIKAAGVTGIYVTHDQQEAFAIADRVVVMNRGQFEQIAPPEALYLRPKTVFAAQFLGLHNILAVQADGSTKLGRFPLDQVPMGETAEFVLLHPAFAELVPAGTANSIPFVIEGCVFRGLYTQITLRHASGTPILLQLPARAAPFPQQGETVQVRFQAGGILPLQA